MAQKVGGNGRITKNGIKRTFNEINDNNKNDNVSTNEPCNKKRKLMDIGNGAIDINKQISNSTKLNQENNNNDECDVEMSSKTTGASTIQNGIQGSTSGSTIMNGHKTEIIMVQDDCDCVGECVHWAD